MEYQSLSGNLHMHMYVCMHVCMCVTQKEKIGKNKANGPSVLRDGLHTRALLVCAQTMNESVKMNMILRHAELSHKADNTSTARPTETTSV